MRARNIQFQVFIFGCLTLLIAISPNNAFGATLNVSTVSYPTNSNPDIGAYESIVAFPAERPLSVFAMAVSNQWVYDSNIQRRTTKINQTTFPTETYEMEILANDFLMAKEWYQATIDQMLFWGQESGGSLFRFDKGLLVIWFPLSVGEQKKSSAAVVGYLLIIGISFSYR